MQQLPIAVLPKSEDFKPSYHPEYFASVEIWNYLFDLYQGSKSWLNLTNQGFEPTTSTERYLPKHPGETPENWRSRINATHFDDLFAQAVRRFVGMIFRGGLQFTGEGDDEFITDINSIDLLQGNAEALISGLAIDAMVYGHCFVMVDYPAIAFEDYSDYLNSGAAPYFVKYLPQQLLDWSADLIDGQIRLVYALLESVEDGETYYYQHTIFNWKKYHKIIVDGKPVYTLVCGNRIDRAYIPLVPLYGGLPIGICESIPPLRAIADKNRTLYQLTSDHYRKMSLCCHPVPVLKDLMREQGEPLEIGPNAFVELRDPNGSFNWEEPLALSLEQSRKDLQDLRESIAKDSADFLTNPADRQSASATNLLTHPVEASLANFIRTFSNGINDAIAIYYEMVDLQSPPKIVLEANVFPDATMDSQALFAVQTVFAAEIVSKDEARKMIRSLGWDI
jgi:hypothetical protein